MSQQADAFVGADVVKLSFRDAEFQMRFYEPFRLVFVGAQLTVLSVLVIEESIEVALILIMILLPISAVLACVATWIMISQFKFHAGPEGIVCMNIWGKNQLVPWENIKRVAEFNFVGMHYLRIWSTSDSLPIWLPMFMSQRDEFVELIANYLDTNHQLLMYFND